MNEFEQAEERRKRQREEIKQKRIRQLRRRMTISGCILLCIDGSCCCEDTYTEVSVDKEEIIYALKAMGYEKMSDVFEESFK